MSLLFSQFSKSCYRDEITLSDYQAFNNFPRVSIEKNPAIGGGGGGGGGGNKGMKQSMVLGGMDILWNHNFWGICLASINKEIS